MPKRARDGRGGYLPERAAPPAATRERTGPEVAASSVQQASDPPPLRPFQAEGVRWLEQRPHALLADEMGLGKTRQLLESAVEPVLVVAPAMVTDSGTWADEIDRWTPGLDVTVTAYSRIVTRRGGKVVSVVPEPLRRDWGTLILDEAHYVKTRKTSWTQTALKLAERSQAVHTATGTPIPNWAHEAFTLLQLAYPEKAHPGAELGSYWRWAGRWFDCSPTRFSQGLPSVGRMLGCGEDCRARPATDPCEHYREFAAASFGDRMLRRLVEDVLGDLPPKTEITVHCPMTPKQARAYRAMKRDYLAQVDGRELVAWNDGARHARLLQLSTGLEAVDPGLTGSGKLDQLQAHLAGRSRPALVFAHYQASVQAACRRARETGADAEYIHGETSPRRRGEIAQAFKRGDLGVLVGSLDVLAEGLTFTQADLCIFVEKSPKTYRNEQAARRIWRMGQTRPVTVYDYVTPGTVDEGLRRLIADKAEDQLRTLTAAQLVPYL
jgi:SNF2 family DNA or RNA helicase